VGSNIRAAIHPYRLRIVPDRLDIRIICVLAAAAGAFIAIWARRTLGGNWSGTVTIKENHELVRSGPYRYVRHPIYAGLLLMAFASAIYSGSVESFYIAAIVLGLFVYQSRIEERWMLEQFGGEYREYMRGVKGLVPGVV